MMRAIERFLFVVALIPGVFIGLPIAAVKFVLTGSSGIEWYMDTVFEKRRYSYGKIQCNGAQSDSQGQRNERDFTEKGREK